MNVWILTAIFLIGFLILYMLQKKKNNKHDEGFGDFLQFNKKFTKQQDAYFQDKLDKQIYVNPGLNVGDLNSAIFQPDMFLAKTEDRDYTTYLAPDPYDAFIEKDTMCRKARNPKDMPIRGPRDLTGCGWWYLEDGPSTGALGTLDGPIKPSTLPGGGEWIWDVNTAVMREEMKVCKRIKQCDLVTIPSIKGKCGFCARLGYAVPILSNGANKYPENAPGSCAETTKTTIDQCRPPPPPVITPEGDNCKNLGYPSPDNRIRLYTNSECNQLEGNWYQNGECLRRGGGSYSAACSRLNGLRNKSPRLCDPRPSGALSKECMISVATGLGFQKTGSLLNNLYTGKNPNDTDNHAVQILGTMGISIPPAALSSGMIDMGSLGDTYTKIYNAMTSAPTVIGRQAAKWLVVGTSDFDVCDIDSSSYGPFPTTCVQQEFRKVGCQASGAAYPTAASVSNYSSKQWNEVRKTFQSTYESMKSTNMRTQDKAVQDCLGIASFRPPPPPPPPNVLIAVRNDSLVFYARHTPGTVPTWVQMPGNLAYVTISRGRIGGTNSAGTIYFADNYANARWVQSTGWLAQFSLDKGVVFGVNPQGNMYIANNGNNAEPNWMNIPRGPGDAFRTCVSDGKVFHSNTGHGLLYADNYLNARWIELKLQNASNGLGPGAVYQVAVDKDIVVVVSGGWGFQENQVWCYDSGKVLAPNWFRIEGPLMKWVSIKNGSVYGVGLDGTLYFKMNYKSGGWDVLPGININQIDVDRE